ncbi:MAG: membrane protein insertase YidC [Solobacterium sp.]|nr:membrane protein insertase YidC [Solobacterium sp.]
MKQYSPMKKILLIGSLVASAVILTGCTIPTDPETHEIIQITNSTTFSEIMGSESWFSAILVWPLAQVLNKLAPVIGVVGAIALVTIVVNGILMVFTLKSTVATQQMQLLQPEMDKIQRKYEGKDDEASKMKQATEMQALYKKYNVNPFSMILITFLQFPIIIAMYQSVQRSTAIRTGTFMGLSLDQTILNGLRNGQWGYLIIFVVMGICQFFSMMLPQMLAKKKAEQEAAKHHRKPETAQNSQQKIMQYYMMAMILVFGLMWPAAMSVYWAIYSLVTILKTLLVQKIIEKQQKEGAKK